MAAPIPVHFIGESPGGVGSWQIVRSEPYIGAPLPPAESIAVHEGAWSLPTPMVGAFCLRGTAGHARYVGHVERTALNAMSAPLGRPEATCAALIPITKSDAWWNLSQDERRQIFEERSHHIQDSMKYLPAIARRLYQSRELGGPFDFLTWFEYAPENAGLFEDLVAMLRQREEWRYVTREHDLRLAR